MREIKDRLKFIRERRGHVRAVDAARAFGWPQSTYLGHENGDRSPGRQAAEKYAKAFRVPLGWLLNGEGPAPTLNGEPDRLASAIEAVRGLPADLQDYAADALELFLRSVNAPLANVRQATASRPPQGNPDTDHIPPSAGVRLALAGLEALKSAETRPPVRRGPNTAEPATRKAPSKAARQPARKA